MFIETDNGPHPVDISFSDSRSVEIWKHFFSLGTFARAIKDLTLTGARAICWFVGGLLRDWPERQLRFVSCHSWRGKRSRHAVQQLHELLLPRTLVKPIFPRFPIFDAYCALYPQSKICLSTHWHSERVQILKVMFSLHSSRISTCHILAKTR